MSNVYHNTLIYFIFCVIVIYHNRLLYTYIYSYIDDIMISTIIYHIWYNSWLSTQCFTCRCIIWIQILWRMSLAHSHESRHVRLWYNYMKHGTVQWLTGMRLLGKRPELRTSAIIYVATPGTCFYDLLWSGGIAIAISIQRSQQSGRIALSLKGIIIKL